MKIGFALFFSLALLVGCLEESKEQKPTYDKYGNQTKDCSIRDAKGHGPYETLGRLSSRACKSKISELCNQSKYKQIHKHKGHFARGKFGKKIMIGLCP